MRFIKAIPTGEGILCKLNLSSRFGKLPLDTVRVPAVISIKRECRSQDFCSFSDNFHLDFLIRALVARITIHCFSKGSLVSSRLRYFFKESCQVGLHTGFQCLFMLRDIILFDLLLPGPDLPCQTSSIDLDAICDDLDALHHVVIGIHCGCCFLELTKSA